MDVLTLSRLQFAVTSAFHFIFVPLTLGLSILVAWMETKYVRTGDETWLKMTKFWGKLFLINFALGVVTGITMEFQFGMNWAEYSRYVGDIFGAPLAIEATVAFFLESVFIGLWIFGWNRVSKKVHALSIWLVAIATNLSALWILLANGWMQKPVGYVLRNGRAEMVDFMALLTNPYGWIKFIHTVLSGYMVAAFFVMGISAWHLLRRNRLDFFNRSFRMGAVFALVTSVLVFATGDYSAVLVAKYQPTKLAAMESVWETQRGVGLNLLLIPNELQECNEVEGVCVPKMLSYLAFHTPDAEIKGLKEFPKELRPPVTLTFLSFRIMVGLGVLMALAALVATSVAGCGPEAPDATSDAPDGSDEVTGLSNATTTVYSESALKSAIANAKPGDVITVSGTIYLTSTLQLLNSGTSTAKINLTGGTLDCSRMSSGWCVKCNGSYWNITNMTIRNNFFERTSAQSGDVASSEVVSFSLASTGRLSSSTFGQASLDPQTDTLYITENGSSGTQIWVVTNASTAAGVVMALSKRRSITWSRCITTAPSCPLGHHSATVVADRAERVGLEEEPRTAIVERVEDDDEMLVVIDAGVAPHPVRI